MFRNNIYLINFDLNKYLVILYRMEKARGRPRKTNIDISDAKERARLYAQEKNKESTRCEICNCNVGYYNLYHNKSNKHLLNTYKKKGLV